MLAKGRNTVVLKPDIQTPISGGFVLAALLEASRSGKGQVVDAAMCDGAASLMAPFFDLTAMGRWREGRERNLLDVERLVEAAQPYLDRAAPHEQLFDGEDLANFERLSAAVKTAQGEKP